MPHRKGTERTASGASETAVVIGGGMAGLVAAAELADAGYAVTVLEKSPGFGGCVSKHEVAGLTLDAGAESFANRSTAVADLAAALGLADRICAPSAAGAWLQLPAEPLRDGAVPMPATGILGIPADPQAPDVVRAIGKSGARRAAMDKLLPVGSLARKESVSLAELVSARMGDRVLKRLVTPVASGVLSALPEVLDADAAAPGLRAALVKHGSLAAAVGALRSAAPAGSAVGGLEGGMFQLAEALVDKLTRAGAVLRTNTTATSVTRAGARWEIEVEESGAGQAAAEAGDMTGNVPPAAASGASSDASAAEPPQTPAGGAAAPASDAAPAPDDAAPAPGTALPPVVTVPAGAGPAAGADDTGSKAAAVPGNAGSGSAAAGSANSGDAASDSAGSGGSVSLGAAVGSLTVSAPAPGTGPLEEAADAGAGPAGPEGGGSGEAPAAGGHRSGVVRHFGSRHDGRHRPAAGNAPSRLAPDLLVVAVDAAAAGPLLRGVLPELAAHSPKAGPAVELVTLVVDLPELDAAPRGTGVLVSADVAGVQAKALTHATAKWPWLAAAAGPGCHVLRLSYGRATGTAGDSTVHDDRELLAQALADASVLLDLPVRFEDVLGWDVVRWVGALPAATVGHAARVTSVRDLAAGQDGLELVGAWLSGTGLAAVAADTSRRVRALIGRRRLSAAGEF